MYKIGDFSRLCQVSVKTLHHYDDVGLVRPAWVDPETGYRFYRAAQVAQVRRIRNLRALGFSLEQIAEVLDGHATSQSLLAVLHAKRHELAQLARETSSHWQCPTTVVSDRRPSTTLKRGGKAHIQE